jgi:sugar lactone lactonase YvrE
VLAVIWPLFGALAAEISSVTEPYAFTTLTKTKRDLGATSTGSAAQVAIDSEGNVYIAETSPARVMKIDAAGEATLLARGKYGSEAPFENPKAIAAGRNETVYVADWDHSTIHKVASDGTVSLLAGSGRTGSEDGVGANASFNRPSGIAVDERGNVYVSENNTIRKISPVGAVTTLAGKPGANRSDDGEGSNARFTSSTGIAADGAGNVYVAAKNAIRKITPTGVVSTLAGNANSRGSANGSGALARFNEPDAIAVDGAGNVFVSDTRNNTIRKITPEGIVSTLGGLNRVSRRADGVGSAARSNRPQGIAVDRDGKIYVADVRNDSIRVGIPAETEGEAAAASQRVKPTPLPPQPPLPKDGRIFVAQAGGTVDVYSTAGELIRRSLLSWEVAPASIAVLGNRLFVPHWHNHKFWNTPRRRVGERRVCARSRFTGSDRVFRRQDPAVRDRPRGYKPVWG